MKNHRSVRSVRSVARCAASTEGTADAWILREKIFPFPQSRVIGFHFRPGRASGTAADRGRFVSG
jgi:hypothetical protein